MITIAVCDDEKYIADQVKKLAARFFREKIWRHPLSGFRAEKNYYNMIKT